MVDTQTFSAELTKEVETLFALGAHLGHKKNRLHPRARRFVYKIVNGSSIIDLTLTVSLLIDAKRVLTQAGRDNKDLLVVVTKKVASQFVDDYCKTNAIACITSKWLPGLLTNFETLMKNVKKLQELKIQRASGELEKFVKHERMAIEKEIGKLDKLYGGILDVNKKPDIILTLDIKKESNAVKEAHFHKIPVIAVADTNGNPDLVSYPVVMNDDSPALAQHVLAQLIDAYIKGREETAKEAAKEKAKEQAKEAKKN